MAVSKNKRHNCILVIPDLHTPYQHVDAFKFLDCVKSKYKPDTIVNLGDEIDGHAISFHPSNQDLFSAGDELKAAIKELKVLAEIFPKMHLIESNHGSLYLRKIKAAGLPITILKSYNEILEVPKTWEWSFDLTLPLPNGTSVYFHHGKSKAPGALSKNMSCNSSEGHYHGSFDVYYWANPNGLFWGVHSGCLVDGKSLAMEYGKNSLPRPILGCTIIKDSYPQLIPMVITTKHRWIGKI